MTTFPTDLTTQHCEPCEGGVEPLNREQFQGYLDQVKDWQVIEDKVLEREFVCKNFSAAVRFINQIADIAENEGHHPDLSLYAYKKLKVSLTTHAIGGLSANDFIMAAKWY